MFGSKRIVLIGLFAGLTVIMLSSSAQASPISDISDGLNSALFGGANLYAAQLILTASVMTSVGMVLAMLRMDPIGIFIILFCVLAALTAIGWADITIILVAAMITVALFGKRVTTYVTGGGGGGDDD